MFQTPRSVKKRHLLQSAHECLTKPRLLSYTYLTLLGIRRTFSKNFMYFTYIILRFLTAQNNRTRGFIFNLHFRRANLCTQRSRFGIHNHTVRARILLRPLINIPHFLGTLCVHARISFARKSSLIPGSRVGSRDVLL